METDAAILEEKGIIWPDYLERWLQERSQKISVWGLNFREDGYINCEGINYHDYSVFVQIPQNWMHNSKWRKLIAVY